MFVALVCWLISTTLVHCSDQKSITLSNQDLQLLTAPQKEMYERFLKNKQTIDHAYRFAQNCIEYAKIEQKTIQTATQLATAMAHTICTDACKRISTIKNSLSQ